MSRQILRQLYGHNFLSNQEINGALNEVIAAEAELDRNDATVLWIPPEDYAPPGLTYPIHEWLADLSEPSKQLANDWFDLIYFVNFAYLSRHVQQYAGQEDHASVIAYLRTLCYIEGFASPEQDLRVNRYGHNLCRILRIPVARLIASDATWTLATHAAASINPHYTDADIVAQINHPLGTGPIPIGIYLQPTLTPEARAALREHFRALVASIRGNAVQNDAMVTAYMPEEIRRLLLR